TEAQVMAFQQSQGLPVTGVADEQTLQTLQHAVNAASQASPTGLRIGDRDEAVIQLKIGLDQVGFTVPGNTTNYFGSQTEAQVMAFQQSQGLPVTGVADEQTLLALQDAVNIPSELTGLRFGDRDEAVIQLKIDLDKVGFTVPGNTTNYFGSQTEAQVTAFQLSRGLPATGVVDVQTLLALQDAVNALPPPTPTVFRLGDRHDAVIQLKADLDKVGFTVPGNMTNLYGSQTEAQVKAFQHTYNLRADGIAGPATLNKLKEVAANPPVVLRNGVRHSSVIQLKVDLGRVGFPVPGNNTNLFGDQTEAQVRAFQRANRLVVTGVADPYTLKTLQDIVKKLPTGPLQGYRIIIDAGHGGSDSGAIGVNGLKEKDVVLDISKRVEKKLKAAGATVIMTRSTDVFITLDERVRIGNNSNASSFVSIHANSFNKSARGVETYWNRSSSSSLSKSLAEEIQKELVKAMETTDRGVKEGNFRVIREITIPSVLVEVGFIDNNSDGAKLAQSRYRERIADAIYKGTVTYYNNR
ncbi:peptidoglycan-binding protein, partial [Alkalihalobacterium elongatum]|uniref:peptidoglycan-binding protein n=1 Tax=Alkalihalobacterium elongatum TaxID=2675466 RepID=UPI001C1F5BDD